MSAIADVMTTVLAREIAQADRHGMRVLAVTSPMSLVAGLAARHLGAPDLALAAGFSVLDAVDPFPALTLGEASYGVDLAHQSSPADTFVAVARGFVGVCTSPAQLDGRGAANLSGIGGDGLPAVALPGSRGLPDNNDMPGPVWYLFSSHGPRQLVAQVDFVSGPPPSAGRHRRLLTPLGLFELQSGDGWSAVSLHEDVTPADVVGSTGFEIAGTAAAPPTPGPTEDELAVLELVDPQGLRALELLDPTDARQLMSRVATAERERKAER